MLLKKLKQENITELGSNNKDLNNKSRLNSRLLNYKKTKSSVINSI